MKYTLIEIEHFKGISSLNLELDRLPRHPVFTLVGLNESGKTTILEAIHWFYAHDAYDPHDLIPKNQRANFNGEIWVAATLECEPEDLKELSKVLSRHELVAKNYPSTIRVRRVYTYEHSRVKSKGFKWSLRFDARKKRGTKWRSLSSYKGAWKGITDALQSRLFPPVIYYENFLFDVPDKIYLKRVDGTFTSSEQQYRQVVQDVLNALQMDLTIEDHLVGRYEAGTPTDSDNIRAVLDEAGAHISEVVISAWEDIVKMSDRELSITLGDSLVEDENGLFLQIRVKEGRQTYYIRERSLGFRWFFGFVLFTHYRTFRDNQRENAIFLLDEPASNLHPAAQAKLLDAFASLPNKQMVIYATHSHHMIRPDWLSNAFIVKNVAMDYSGLGLKYRAEDTQIEAERYFRYVAKYPQDTDLFRPVLDALDYKPSQLEMVPNLVIVEGKNDFYAMRLAVREVLSAAPEWKTYPSTGKDKTEYVVSLYLAWGRSFIVVLDADAQSTKSRLEKAYGKLVKEKVFTLADVHSSWGGWTMENMFDKRDQAKLVKAAFPESKSVTKSRLNTAIQAAYLGDKEVSLNRYTQGRFEKLFSFIEEKLSDTLG